MDFDAGEGDETDGATSGLLAAISSEGASFSWTAAGDGVQLESISSGAGAALFAAAAGGGDDDALFASGVGDDADGTDTGSASGPMLMMRIGRSTSPPSPSELEGFDEIGAETGACAGGGATAAGDDGRGGVTGLVSGTTTSGEDTGPALVSRAPSELSSSPVEPAPSNGLAAGTASSGIRTARRDRRLAGPGLASSIGVAIFASAIATTGGAGAAGAGAGAAGAGAAAAGTDEPPGRGTETGLAIKGERAAAPSEGGGGDDDDDASAVGFTGLAGRGGSIGCRAGFEGGGTVPVPTIVGIRFRAAGADDTGCAQTAPSA